jgi:hypothetical protein
VKKRKKLMCCKWNGQFHRKLTQVPGRYFDLQTATDVNPKSDQSRGANWSKWPPRFCPGAFFDLLDTPYRWNGSRIVRDNHGSNGAAVGFGELGARAAKATWPMWWAIPVPFYTLRLMRPLIPMRCKLAVMQNKVQTNGQCRRVDIFSYPHLPPNCPF